MAEAVLPSPGPSSSGNFSRSLRVQLAALITFFLVLPVLLYSTFASADRDREKLLLEAVQTSGAMVGKALAPMLSNLQPGDFGKLPAELARFESPRQSIKLLFQPSALGASLIGGDAGFFYVAGIPAVSSADIQEERALLASLGVLDKLARSCNGDIPLSEQVRTKSGELLTSITPVQSPAGCWGVVVAEGPGALGQPADSRAWLRVETRLAGVVYAVMALLAFAIFAVVWSNLRRFKSVAGAIEKGESFEKSTTVPELAAIGREFDAMVRRLTRVADIIREAAEDNAHAFKGPIAVIRQSVELVRGGAKGADAETGIAAIAASLDRLDGLVQSARRIDSATAELLEVGRAPIDLSSLVRAFAADYSAMIVGVSIGGMTPATGRNQLHVEVTDKVIVEGRADLIETILENLVENALSFSPPGGRVDVGLRVETRGILRIAALSVADKGPGVHPDQLEAIFERYYSSRPGAEKAGADKAGTHFGIGLWLVKQHALALNGAVTAEDRADGGLVVTVRLPISK